MSDQARPDLTRSKPRAADDLPDPADPAPAPTAHEAPPAAPEKHRPMVAIDTGSTATYAIQYRLTEAERDQLLRMQEARGDRRGIDTMRWFLANFADKAIDRARRETAAREHHYR